MSITDGRGVKRCGWVNLNNPAYVAYHDSEWGVPCHSDRKLFEILLLECFQAGLSWECVLNKREGFRRTFDGFDPVKVAAYGDEKKAELMMNPAIIRNRGKIDAAVSNAAVFLNIVLEFGSFDKYLWGFTAGEVVKEECTAFTRTPLSDTVSRDLKRRGMKFTGSVAVYAYLQAVGVINGHEKCCDFG